MQPAADSLAAPKFDGPQPPASDPSPIPPPAPAPAPDPPLPAPAQAQAQAQKTVTWSEQLTTESPTHVPAAAAAESSQYVSRGPASSSSKGAVEAMKETLSRWGKSVGETTKMVESLSRDTWQHCYTDDSAVAQDFECDKKALSRTQQDSRGAE